jgi:hypothetical protein
MWSSTSRVTNCETERDDVRNGLKVVDADWPTSMGFLTGRDDMPAV